MRNSKIKLKLFITTALFVIASFFVVAQVSAAETFFETKSSQIRIADTFEVGFFLNTENQDINAVEGRITFPESLLKLKEIRDGNSIINFWIERPKAVNGEISFSGIIPGGYFDKRGLIFSLVFQSAQEGHSLIEIRHIKALLNDGQGTETKTAASNLQFVISKEAPSLLPEAIEKKDTVMPEEFEPVLVSDPAVFDGKYFLVFSAQDKGSGIDHYEIQETRYAEMKNKKWVIGESPYLLKDQGLKSYIYVKAIDKSGNVRTAFLTPTNLRFRLEKYAIYTIMIIVALFLVVLWRKNRKK